MIVRHFRLDVPNLEPNAYLVGCEHTGQALMVDAGVFSEEMDEFLRGNGMKLRTIFITHHHWDHTDGLKEAIERFQPERVLSFLGNVGGCATERIAHGGKFQVGAIPCHAVHTPGHTDDGMSLILPGVVFSGDALFCGSVGGTSNPVDAQRQIEAIRAHLFSLPDDYEVFSGHGPVTTIGIERAANPFLSGGA
ncbi:MAG: MBL fold metallo-hydrolase [Candidatus Hydrogenedentes bacterium]|nr:MBL fold metallo-hydrolase [Candidatus Hydrogenedentota bacterium]